MASQPESIEPAYAPDDRWKPDFVRVSIQIPKLKVKTQIEKTGFIPKFNKAAVNARIETEFKDRSFTVIVKGDKSMQNKCYKLHIRKLPREIDPTQCSYEVKRDRMLVYLRKVTAESWYPELEEGLDMYESENSEDED